CRSPLYASRPFGPVAQPDFVNAVAGLLTRLDADGLFAALKALESALGRTPGGPRWGPRLIDLDLLVFGREVAKDRSCAAASRYSGAQLRSVSSG
ncbi:7,8-Dihydro-6-hydroxymethylpterin-pyrophosphokinase, HPPK domain protein, partial [mine drainage metagenome]